MNLKYKLLGGVFLMAFIFLAGIALGHKLFSKPEVPPVPASSSTDKSKEKRSGTIVKYLPSKCPPPTPGMPVAQEIASIETFDSEIKNDISAEVKPPEKKYHEVAYIPKYNFKEAKILQAGSYSYDYYGLYVAENPEIGVKLLFRW